MKMKKLFSGVLALALVCSAFVSVSAATPEESVSPVVTGKVSQIRSGRAVIEFTIDTEGEYGVEYDEEWSEYLGDTASGISTIQVNLTLDPVVDELFSAVSGAKVLGNAPTVSGKSVTYAFGVGDPTEFAQNGDVLFRLNCTLKDSSMTVEKLNEYKLVKSFDNIVVYTKSFAIDGVALGELINDTKYRTDGNGDYTDVTGVYEYTPAEEPDEPTLVENPYVFSFEADQDTDVKITNSRTGDRTYSLPEFVKGKATVYGLLKITEGANVQAGDVFTVEAINGDVASTITEITVK